MSSRKQDCITGIRIGWSKLGYNDELMKVQSKQLHRENAESLGKIWSMVNEELVDFKTHGVLDLKRGELITKLRAIWIVCGIGGRELIDATIRLKNQSEYGLRKKLIEADTKIMATNGVVDSENTKSGGAVMKMKQIENAKKVAKGVAKLYWEKVDAKESAALVGEDGGLNWQITDSNSKKGTLDITVEGVDLLVKGKSRMVAEVAKKSEIKVCDRCGNEFTPNRFTPYQKYCGACTAHKEDEEIKCEVCGQSFLRSKFNPYKKLCKTCTKKARGKVSTKPVQKKQKSKKQKVAA